MPKLKREDGIAIHWDERGQGPTLLVSPNSNVTMPSNYEALISDLTVDHRVVTWDPRGTGQSTRTGPYDLATDAADVAALIGQVGGPVVTVSVGLSPAPLELASTQPRLLEAVVLVGALPPLGPSDGDDGESLLDSDSVVSAVREMLKTDPRGLLRSMLTMGNTQLNEDEIRERLEAQLHYSPSAVTAERGEASLTYDATRSCTALGSRLWMVHWENPMSPRGAAERVGRLLSQAHLIEVEEGALSRPDLTAEVIRAATASVRAPS